MTLQHFSWRRSSTANRGDDRILIDAYRATYGVEAICAVLSIAPSTYYLHGTCAADPTRYPA